ncbi:hypothetical protein D9619_010828 [Psilocybe cf. subviscida]|uniref:NACHT domain-containing protein n=1 Tax=Psilocybe cf. subviscida TaxID=2480587 RepID=A0A8H5BAG0_9AGAR|nr:hypothetical protein D9619_010828 [Psilocybe cf. subviscida]
MISDESSTDQQLSSKGGKEVSSRTMNAFIFPNAQNTRMDNSYVVLKTGTGNITVESRKVIWWILWWILCLIILPGAYMISKHQKWVYEEQRVAFSAPTASLSPDILYGRVAMNAVLDTGGRADDAKCHPGTREEVIGLIERWMKARNSTNGFLWLSGPAGGGKTVIMRTIAERSADQNVHTINFFFFRGDPTRNSAQLLVATLLYQIFQLYPAARDAVAMILSAHPHLLDASLEEQFEMLVSPLSDIIRESSPEGVQVVLLIDGLDECDDSQEQVLRALDSLVTQKESPFRALVTSRPNSRIRMVFSRLASKAQSIFLDDQYSPERDIRHFVISEFDRIKASHPRAHQLPADWPSKSAIKAIVAKSSGQFIYAAAVMRFLSDSPAIPNLSLQRVQGIVPIGNASPFAELDATFVNVLNQADDREATRDILSSILLEDSSQSFSCLSRILRRHSHPPVGIVLSPIHEVLGFYSSRYTFAQVESSLSDLAAIVQHRGDRLVFYHASLADFLQDPSRSQDFHVDVKEFSISVFIAIDWTLDRLLRCLIWCTDECKPPDMHLYYTQRRQKEVRSNAMPWELRSYRAELRRQIIGAQ